MNYGARFFIIIVLGLAANFDAALGQDGADGETQAVQQPVAVEDLLAPGLLAELESKWAATQPGRTTLTDPGNVTILTLTDGFPVYLAAVEDIRSAENPEGGSAAVEDVVFTAGYAVGIAPLTIALPPGEYVLAVRATKRLDGFDGDCVRKVTKDVITGGLRHQYHLYPLRKNAGEYQCFVANFTGPGTTDERIGKNIFRRGTFNINQEQLTADLAMSTNVPAEKQQSAARRLNQIGVAFYSSNGNDFLVKISLVGNSYKLEEWIVE